jgi:hypothetical protein
MKWNEFWNVIEYMYDVFCCVLPCDICYEEWQIQIEQIRKKKKNKNNLFNNKWTKILNETKSDFLWKQIIQQTQWKQRTQTKNETAIAEKTLRSDWTYFCKTTTCKLNIQTASEQFSYCLVFILMK